ncbi:hypothetical protein BLA29_005149 [Euroglyphus maynei]|uniref:Uncharacterized protein n=1 Tax=Euroglyphus maynei TaxID=6958 RepID=A0A1Y3BAX3_EURMA|nr:hypothetical protein BLA29_005149 [Euroglyphus maynei]
MGYSFLMKIPFHSPLFQCLDEERCASVNGDLFCTLCTTKHPRPFLFNPDNVPPASYQRVT